MTVGTKMKVDEFCKKIYKEMDDRVSYKVHREVFLETVDFFNGNEHLHNPLNRDPEIFYFVGRDEPLTGDEIIEGDYLLYDCVGHSGVEMVSSYGSLEEMEKMIMGPAGIQNSFTTEMIAVVNGEVKRYSVDNGFKWLSED